MNFGLLPLSFEDDAAYDRIDEGDDIEIVGDVAAQIRAGTNSVTVRVDDDWAFGAAVDLGSKEREMLLAGRKLAYLKGEQNDGR